MGSCRQAGILPLDEIGKLAAAKYIIRNLTIANLTNTEVELRSDKHFSKRANKNLSLLTIASYTSDLFEKTQINEFQQSCKTNDYLYSIDLHKADFDTEYMY